jgi:hypothetical protein
MPAKSRRREIFAGRECKGILIIEYIEENWNNTEMSVLQEWDL